MNDCSSFSFYRAQRLSENRPALGAEFGVDGTLSRPEHLDHEFGGDVRKILIIYNTRNTKPQVSHATAEPTVPQSLAEACAKAFGRILHPGT